MPDRVKLSFADLNRPGSVRISGTPVELEGWLCPFSQQAEAAYFALVDAPPCCVGCLPRDAGQRVEVFAAAPIRVSGGKVRLAGELHRLPPEDPAGWRHQLRQARLVGPAAASSFALTRRRALTAASLVCVAAAGPTPAVTPSDEPAVTRPVTGVEPQAAVAGGPVIDVHSHAGGVIGVRRVEGHAPFAPLASPMRAGGVAAICLAAVSDSPVHRVMEDQRIRPFRDPEPGELYTYGQASFQRIHDLARDQGLGIVATAADLAAARAERPSIVVSAEGGDFLEGQAGRVDEAHARWTLRHLQLTHYRVNELGDIQTEPPVHGGLTEAGAAVIRRCNQLGVVVDVAHGTFELVSRAASVTSKPLVLSHTSLSNAPRPQSRLISPDHARVIAGTGGVIGVWPPASIFPDMTALAAGIARLVDVVGVEHVGLGTDMGGLVGPAAFASYRDLPALRAALLARGFQADDVARLLGGNYLRVFTASMA